MGRRRGYILGKPVRRLSRAMKIRMVKALLNGYRLPHGYALVKRKRRR